MSADTADNEESTVDDEYLQLRSLLLGSDYEAAILEQIKKSQKERVSDVLADAFTESARRDSSLSEAMAPVIESSIDASIKSNPEKITNVIFPVIGPAVRKAVSRAFADLLKTLNSVLQQSLSVRSLFWRIKAWRLGISYAEFVLIQTIEYRVEQVFFIHSETGVLLHSEISDGIYHQDPDLVSAMLTAITDFVSDSFNSQDQNLNVIQFGDLSILISSGPLAILALVVRGTPPTKIQQSMDVALEELHQDYATSLNQFEGDTAEFKSSSTSLRKLLVAKHKAIKQSKPWLAIALISALFLTGGYFSWQKWQIQQQAKKAVQYINQSAGYQVINYTIKGNQLFVEALRSPGALPQQHLEKSLSSQLINLKLASKSTSLDDPRVYLGYLGNQFNAQFKVVTNNGLPSLKVIGSLTQEEILELKSDPLVVSLFSELDDSQLSIKPPISKVEAIKSQFNQKLQMVQNTSLYFESGQSTLNSQSAAKLNQMIAALKWCFDNQELAQTQILQISVMGFADNDGNKLANLELSKNRARLVQQILLENGIEKDVVISWGYGDRSSPLVPNELQRRVSLQVFHAAPELAPQNQHLESNDD
ncbi:OmpA family protein [Aliikangiella sp. IMCC44653]